MTLPAGASTTFLHVAAAAEAYEVVTALVNDFGANPCGAAGRSIRTPLHLACIKAGLHCRKLKSSFSALPFTSPEGSDQENILDKIPVSLTVILEILADGMVKKGVDAHKTTDLHGFTTVDLMRRAATGESLFR
ncbi:MAG: hypothetical protein QG604_578 [Candidatus Dependentiae bacterium]|nr:hypothetical protein [Candidatus Dependentiae bacterium]